MKLLSNTSVTGSIYIKRIIIQKQGSVLKLSERKKEVNLMGNREFWENMRRRVEAIRHVSDHSIFNELRGKIVITIMMKNVWRWNEVGDFHRNGFNIMLEIFGWDVRHHLRHADSRLGDYDIAPTVQTPLPFWREYPLIYSDSKSGCVHWKNDHEFHGKKRMWETAGGQRYRNALDSRPFKTFR